MNNFKPKTLILFALAIVIVFGFNLLMMENVAAKETEKNVAYKLNFSFDDNLLLFKGQYVRVTLTSGQILSGTVKDVEDGLLHLEKLSNRSYFDALIRTKDISAMDAKFRGFK